jgi:hypothetical protein
MYENPQRPPSAKICSAIAQAIDCLLKTPVTKPRLSANNGSIATPSENDRSNSRRPILRNGRIQQAIPKTKMSDCDECGNRCSTSVSQIGDAHLLHF